MPVVKATVWTPRRKWLGNAIPCAFWFVPTAFGIAQLSTAPDILSPGLGWMAVGVVLGWVSLNYFGFFENKQIRERLERMFAKASGVDRYLVGFASPRYSGVLDAHEDVGFLEISKDKLAFVSETRRVEVLPNQISEVRFRANVHTFVGLGRWISVEGSIAGRPVRLLVEPREYNAMLPNLGFGNKLKAILIAWADIKPATAKSPKRK